MKVSLAAPNLAFKLSLQHMSEKINNTFSEECGIICCFSTRHTLDMAYHLKQRGFKVVSYHGQLDVFELSENAKRCMERRSDVMCVN